MLLFIVYVCLDVNVGTIISILSNKQDLICIQDTFICLSLYWKVGGIDCWVSAAAAAAAEEEEEDKIAEEKFYIFIIYTLLLSD